MKVSEAKPGFLGEIWKAIKSEFPYTALTEGDFHEKLGSGRVWVFSLGAKEFRGFTELEEIPSGIGRVNAVFVKEKFRRQGFGTKLLRHAVKFLRGRGMKRIVLVVSSPNAAGKKLYEKCGFGFLRKLPKKVGGMEAEEWGMELRPP